MFSKTLAGEFTLINCRRSIVADDSDGGSSSSSSSCDVEAGRGRSGSSPADNDAVSHRKSRMIPNLMGNRISAVSPSPEHSPNEEEEHQDQTDNISSKGATGSRKHLPPIVC